MLEIIDITRGQLDILYKAVDKLLNNFSDLLKNKKILDDIRREESRVDNIEEMLHERIFEMDLSLTEKIYYRDLVSRIGQISDIIEDLSDRMHIMLIKRGITKMWMYLLLAAGIFMGRSLGTNAAANAFGTAVSTGVIKYKTAIIIISVFVIIGAFLMGAGNMASVNDLAINNAVIPSADEAAEIVEDGEDDKLDLKSAIKAFIVFTCAALTVFLMSYLKFPVSANQSITGAIIG